VPSHQRIFRLSFMSPKAVACRGRQTPNTGVVYRGGHLPRPTDQCRLPNGMKVDAHAAGAACRGHLYAIVARMFRGFPRLNCTQDHRRCVADATDRFYWSIATTHQRAADRSP